MSGRGQLTPPDASLDGVLAHAATGEPITRDATCAGCGAAFTQIQLNPKWLEKRSEGARLALEAQLSDDWVPELCPRCERQALERERDPHGLVGRRDPALGL
ncbi:MAG TPA: hypothetical protein VFN76_09845 [Candidatus Limnocylindria bacterium]|nr:hypothetical protein [Candidatus Limnocylindria bacterium]